MRYTWKDADERKLVWKAKRGRSVGQKLGGEYEPVNCKPVIRTFQILAHLLIVLCESLLWMHYDMYICTSLSACLLVLQIKDRSMD